jgi:hypothetical protein
VDKKLHSHRLFRGLIALCFGVTLIPGGLRAGTWPGAQITQVIHDVRLLGANAEPRPAAIDDKVDDGTAVQTGADSWIELKFAHESLARLGGKTDFAFKDKGRRMDLKGGAALLQVSKSARGTQIEGAGVAAAVKGTTVMFECYPTVYKFLVLEGTARLFRPGHWGDSILVRPGQMVIGKPNTPLSDPVDFDIGRFLKTSRFLVDFAPLPSGPLLAREADKQQQKKSKKRLIETNLVIFGGGTSVSLVNPENAVPDPATTAPASSPAPTQIPREVGSAVVDRMATRQP